MGLFSFLNKKEGAVSSEQSFNLDALNTDLPSIEGSKLDELKLPSLEEPTQSDDPLQSDTSRLPSMDEQEEPYSEPIHEEPIGGYHDNSFHGLPDDISEDMNQLFLSDPEWKEPDWQNFEPYTEDTIEPPTMHDFGIDPPQPLENPDITLPEQRYEVPEFTDIEPKERNVPDDIPYDVFVKGTDFRRVITEMEDVKNILGSQDEMINQVMTIFKQEELTINSCKDNMELLYKKMLQVDKKVFA